MKRFLAPFLPAAAGAALLACGTAHAQSSVTLYGIVGVDYYNVSGLFDATGQKVHLSGMDDNALVASRIGLKGVEDLGGGLKGIFDLEAGIHTDSGSANGTFWNRGSYVGLSGSFGTVKLGRQWNTFDDYMGNYFIFGYYAPFQFEGFYTLSDLYNNAIKYTTPKWGGFEGGFMYSLGEVSGESSSAGSHWEAIGTYTLGGFSGALGYSTINDNTDTESNDTWTLGLNYKFGPVRARFGYADATVDAPATLPAYKAQMYDVGLDWYITPAFTLTGDYLMNKIKDSDAETSYFRLIGVYQLSKRTSFNANMIFLQNDGGAAFAFKPSDQPGLRGGVNEDQRIFTLGIVHMF